MVALVALGLGRVHERRADNDIFYLNWSPREFPATITSRGAWCEKIVMGVMNVRMTIRKAGLDVKYMQISHVTRALNLTQMASIKLV